MVNNKNRYYLLAAFATTLAICVVMLGAYTRLKGAGLGCPDWPGCYGQLSVPQTDSAITKAQQAFPGQTVVPAKAWPEMIHRYFAGTLGLLIFALGGLAIWWRRQNSQQPTLVPTLLIGLVIFQAMLGMWTVTWQLLPLVVMGHLLGGMSIAAMLCWLTLSSRQITFTPTPGTLTNWLKPFAILGIAVVVLQIFLGGWTSANYASIICPNFPFCQGTLFPHFDFSTAFNFSSPIGTNYQGGVLGTTARVTIQMMHRYGAFITATYVFLLSIATIRHQNVVIRATGWLVLTLLTVQFCLGVANIDTKLALPIAVAHNGVALLLLLSLVTLTYYLFQRDDHVASNH